MLIKRKRVKFNGWVIYQCKGNHLGYQSRVYKCSDHFQLFQKFATNMTMSNVPTNPAHGVSWHLVWGLLDPIELLCRREIFSYFLYILVLDIFKLIMVTIYFIFSQLTCFFQITMSCVNKCQLTLISWDGTTVQLTPSPCAN